MIRDEQGHFVPDVDRREAVRRMTLAGHTAAQIAEALHTTPRTVQRDRAATKVARPVNVVSIEALWRAGELLDDGCSYKEAARTTGISCTTIARRFPGRGWTPEQAAEMSSLNLRLRRAAAS